MKQTRSLRSLEAAWRNVRSNGFNSKSPIVQKEIRQFDDDAYGKLRSLQARLVHGSFVFPPARGVPIPKSNKKDIRPLVVASVETRIVQRAILDTMQGVAPLQGHFRNPYSFGGIKRGEDAELAAVPAAIQAVLDAIGAGGAYVVCADITAFFTRISKSAVADIVASVIDDAEFMSLFRRSIHVELENLAALREHADRFPTEDIGVAQGSALNPPTILPKTVLARAGWIGCGECAIDAEHDIDVVLVDLDPLDQGADQVALHEPVDLAHAVADPFGEVLEPSDHE